MPALLGNFITLPLSTSTISFEYPTWGEASLLYTLTELLEAEEVYAILGITCMHWGDEALRGGACTTVSHRPIFSKKRWLCSHWSLYWPS